METFLPEEITEFILCHENLSISDVVNLSLTNKYYYYVIRNNNTLWKKKYFQSWPQLSKLFEKHDPDFCWYEELQYVYDLKRKTREILYSMSSRFYKHYQLFGSHYSEWMELYEETPRSYYYLVHDLKNIVNTRVAINTIEVVPISTPGNKTLQYYASKVLRYLLYLRLMDESHVRQPLKLPKLETAIVFVTQWCRPNVDVAWKDIIPKKFDELAEKVKEQLKVVHPNHPLFAKSEDDLKIWRENGIDGNKYNAEDRKKVVQALESVIPQDNDLPKEITATDLVEIYGEYKAILLTYQCVARRLGLKFEIRTSHDEDMLKQKPFDAIKAAIDEYRFLRPTRCSGLHLLKLLEALSLLDISSKTFMKECYMDHTVYSPLLLQSAIRENITDPSSVKPKMMKVLVELPACKIMMKSSRKVRPSNLKYAVGMVMQHVTRRYKCVIYDWDPTCFPSIQWRRQNNIHSLVLTENQPFYSILTKNRGHQYTAQECLEPIADTASLIMVEDIGKYFSHAFETHFVPNAEKQKQYPEDAAVRHMFHQKLKAGNLNS